MPPYPPATITALKDTLRCRRDAGYHFTPEDVTALEAKTGLERASIVRWALDVRASYDTAARLASFFEGKVAVRDMRVGDVERLQFLYFIVI